MTITVVVNGGSGANQRVIASHESSLSPANQSRERASVTRNSIASLFNGFAAFVQRAQSKRSRILGIATALLGRARRPAFVRPQPWLGPRADHVLEKLQTPLTQFTRVAGRSDLDRRRVHQPCPPVRQRFGVRRDDGGAGAQCQRRKRRRAE